MKLSLYQIDAFTNHLFGGNPAAVIPLDQWISESLMQRLAMENNLSETVFFVPSASPDADYEIRWFTPESEIDLCGHATLASAFVLFHVMGYGYPAIRFQSKSGILVVTKEFRQDQYGFSRLETGNPKFLARRIGEWIRKYCNNQCAQTSRLPG